MQVFVPYSEPLFCAETLWNDKKRFNKQIIECKQIIKAINGNLAWKNHPVTLMYKSYINWLNKYTECFEKYKSYQTETNLENKLNLLNELLKLNSDANKIKPNFLTEEFCNNHKKRLYTKNKNLYPQFEKYGTTDENWYVVNNILLKYINGKRIT